MMKDFFFKFVKIAISPFAYVILTKNQTFSLLCPPTPPPPPPVDELESLIDDDDGLKRGFCSES
jgi:hypothetical protein